MRRVRQYLCTTSIVLAAACASGANAATAIDLDHLTATQAAADICDGKYSSEALGSAVLARAKARAELNVFTTLDEAGAIKAARAYDKAHAKHRHCEPLGGVPVAVKD